MNLRSLPELVAETKKAIEKEFSTSRFAAQSNGIATTTGGALLDHLVEEKQSGNNDETLNTITIGSLVCALAYTQSKYRGTPSENNSVSMDSASAFYQKPYYPLIWEELWQMYGAEVRELLSKKNFSVSNNKDLIPQQFAKDAKNPIFKILAALKLRSEDHIRQACLILVVGTKLMKGELPFESEKLKTIFPGMKEQIEALNIKIAPLQQAFIEANRKLYVLDKYNEKADGRAAIYKKELFAETRALLRRERRVCKFPCVNGHSVR